MRNPNPFYHKHECEKCGALNDCYVPGCRGEWYVGCCGDCFRKHLDEASAIVASWPEWKRNALSSPEAK
jgi:hypothetical protein